MKNYSKTYKICIPNTHFCPNSVLQKKKKKEEKKERGHVLGNQKNSFTLS